MSTSNKQPKSKGHILLLVGLALWGFIKALLGIFFSSGPGESKYDAEKDFDEDEEQATIEDIL
jgi:hypothetical protein